MVDFSQTYEDAGRQWNIDPILLQAMARQESRESNTDQYGRLIASPAGAQGWMQFIPQTAAKYGVDVRDPRSSIYGAAHYMSDLLDQTGGNLPAALALYNGSPRDQSQAYARAVLGHYQGLQAQRQEALRQSGVTSPSQPDPNVIDVSVAGGPSPPPLAPNVSGRTGTKQGASPTTSGDFFSPVQGAPQATPAPVAPAPATGGGFFAPVPPQMPTVTVSPGGGVPMPAPAVAAPTTTPAVVTAAPPAPPTTSPAVVVPDVTPTPQQPPPKPPPAAPPAPAVAPDMTPAPSAVQGPPEAPPSWYQRNVGTPLAAMMDPRIPQPPSNYLLNMPLLQSLGAGIVQGVRNVGQTANRFGEYINAQSPFLAAVDRAMGFPERSQLPEQTQAFREQYASDIPAAIGEVMGQTGVTYPVGWVAGTAGRVAGAVPVVGRVAAPTVAGAVGGSLQNLAGSVGTGQTPMEAATTGAVGGGTIGGLFGLWGARQAYSAARRAEQQIADRLNVRLSAGQRAGYGSAASRIEDATAILPGSGAGRLAEEQRGQIARVIAREAGIPGNVGSIDTAVLNAAETRSGDLIENAARRIAVPGDRQFMADLSRIETAAQQAGPATPQAYTVRNLGDQLMNLMAGHGGALPGAEFQRFIARGGPLDTALRSSVPEVRAAATALRESLFNAAQRTGIGSNAALRDLTEGRYQWKVIQTVRPVIDRTATGSEQMLLPGLAHAIRREFDMTRTGPGAEMQDLARLISGPLRSLPSSGTAERMAWYRLLGLEAGGAGAGGLAWMLGHPQAAEAVMAGAALPAAGNVLLGRAMRFGPSLGINPLEAARLEFNPLLPRLLGPNVGNQLMLPAPQGAP